MQGTRPTSSSRVPDLPPCVWFAGALALNQPKINKLNPICFVWNLLDGGYCVVTLGANRANRTLCEYMDPGKATATMLKQDREYEGFGFRDALPCWSVSAQSPACLESKHDHADF